ncbi:MAG: TIGR04255 family protein [Sphaerochaeta sp.]|nr:TIGR04255 family protein [Sphaerochaeta sp.]
MNKYPIKLGQCPIVETIFEVKFTPNCPDEVVFGVLFQAISPVLKGCNLVPLPILQIPSEIRKNDPNLINQPHYHLIKDNLVVGIGPRTLFFSNREPYKGWNEFKRFVIQLLEAATQVKVISSVNQTGLRYINVIESPLFSVSNLVVSINEQPLTPDTTASIHTEIKKGDKVVILQLNNSVEISLNNKPVRTVSMIDIGIACNQVMSVDTFAKKLDSILEESHDLEKQTFYDLLLGSYIDAMSPIYT